MTQLRYVYRHQTDRFTAYLRINRNRNNIRFVTLAEHASDHDKQTNSSTKVKGITVIFIIIGLIMVQFNLQFNEEINLEHNFSSRPRRFAFWVTVNAFCFIVIFAHELRAALLV